MTGSEHCLDIYLGRNIIANLILINDQLNWNYSEHWRQSGFAVSPHIPLEGKIPSINIQRFLRNLLPEGNGLEELLSSFHLSKYNTFGLIQALGMDTPGSLVMLLHNQTFPQNAKFRSISSDELEQRLNARNEFSLIIWDAKPRLSVAGVQDKINVIMNQDGELGFGEGSLCSTHILKFEKQKLSHLVLNEFVTMQLAMQCGLKVANVSLKRYGKHPALLVERFDRRIISTKEIERRHTIDGCQALNLSPDYKYERNFGSTRDVSHIREGASLIKLFDFANSCVNPALAKQQIVDWVLFNLLVYNFDAHGKNISFYVNSNGFSLAPFYDLVNIKMYHEYEHEMAMALGDEFNGDTVNAYQLADFAENCYLPRSWLAKRIKELSRSLMSALNDSILKFAINDEENKYLKQYQSLVYKRCVHLRSQVDDIVNIEL